jgi:hypothetical protein
MKEFYYYEPKDDKEGSSKKITTCLLIGDEENDEFKGMPFARGVAICSDKDNFSKKIGRAIAKGRAMKALFRGNYGKIRRPDVKDVLPKEFHFKGTVRPDQIGITEKETLFLNLMPPVEEEVA